VQRRRLRFVVLAVTAAVIVLGLVAAAVLLVVRSF
jgi:hypothetical protein